LCPAGVIAKLTPVSLISMVAADVVVSDHIGHQDASRGDGSAVTVNNDVG